MSATYSTLGATMMVRVAVVVFFVVVTGAATRSMAQQPEGQQPEAAAPALLFDIQRFNVQGNTLLKPADITRILAPYTGTKRDFSHVQRALEALEVAYRDVGYGSVQVLLPEQNIASGVVNFNVIEPRIGSVQIDGAQRNDAANIRRSLPRLREGAIPNSKELARDLLLANENPARQLTVLMRSGEAEDKVDATIKVAEDKAWKASFGTDNTGTTATGDYRVNIGYQYANMFNRDHVLTFQAISSPNHWADVQVYGFGYRIPIYSLGSSIEVIGGYSNVNSVAGTVGGLFSISGSGTIGGLRYNQYLFKIGEYEHKLIYGLDYKAFQNQSLFAGTNVSSPDITVHPVGVTYSGTLRREGSDAGFYVNIAQNIPGGNDGADANFKGTGTGAPARADAKAGYRIFRYGANYTRAFANDWQARLQMTGQITTDALIAGEQFGVGGPDSVRGFLVRELSNDRGTQFSAELYTPNLAAKFGWAGLQTRLLTYTDWGWLARNSALPGESTGQSIGSVGVGMRLNAGARFILRTDYARVIDAGGTENKGHTKLNFSASLIF